MARVARSHRKQLKQERLRLRRKKKAQRRRRRQEQQRLRQAKKEQMKADEIQAAIRADQVIQSFESLKINLWERDDAYSSVKKLQRKVKERKRKLKELGEEGASESRMVQHRGKLEEFVASLSLAQKQLKEHEAIILDSANFLRSEGMLIVKCEDDLPPLSHLRRQGWKGEIMFMPNDPENLADLDALQTACQDFGLYTKAM